MSSARTQKRLQQQWLRMNEARESGALPAPQDLAVRTATIQNRLNAGIPLWDQSAAAYMPKAPQLFPSHTPQDGALQQGAAAAQQLAQNYLLRNRLRRGEMFMPMPLEAGKRPAYPLRSFVRADPNMVVSELRSQGATSLATAQILQSGGQAEATAAALDDGTSRVLLLIVLGSALAVTLFFVAK